MLKIAVLVLYAVVLMQLGFRIKDNGAVLSIKQDVKDSNEICNSLHGDIHYLTGEVKYLNEENAFIQQQIDALKDSGGTVHAEASLPNSGSPYPPTLIAAQVSGCPAYKRLWIDGLCMTDKERHAYLARKEPCGADNPCVDDRCAADKPAFVNGACHTYDEVLAIAEAATRNRRPISTNRHEVPHLSKPALSGTLTPGLVRPLSGHVPQKP